MSHQSDAFAALHEAGLSSSAEGEVSNELKLFGDALESGDEAALSASVEVVTELCQRHGLRMVAAPVLLAFIEGTASNVRRGYAWTNLATFYRDSRSFPEAERALDHAESLFAGENKPEGTASVYSIRGLLASDAGDPDRARRYFKDALALSANQPKRLRIRESLIHLEFDLGQHADARLECESWFTEAEHVHRAFRDDLRRVLHTYGLIGRRYLLLGDRSTAQLIADDCVRVAGLNSLEHMETCAELFDALSDEH